MDKKKIKKETPKKSAKPVTKKVEVKPSRKVAPRRKKTAAAKVIKRPIEKARPKEVVTTSGGAVQPSTIATGVQSTAVVVGEASRLKPPSAPQKSYSGPTILIRWFRSAIGLPERQKQVVQGLGFRRLNEIIVRPDTPMIRGMVNRIPHLVKIEESEQ